MIDMIWQLYSNTNYFICMTLFSVLLCGKRQRRNHFGLRFCFGFIIGVVLSILYPAIMIPSAYRLFFNIFRFFFFFSFCCLVIAFSYKLSITEILYFGICSYAIQHFCFSVFTILIATLNEFGMSVPTRSLAYLVICTVCYIGLFVLIYRLCGKAIRQVTVDIKDKSIILPLLILLSAAIVLSLLGIRYTGFLEVVIFRTYGAFLCITVLYAMYKVFQIGNLIYEKNTIQALTQKQKEQYELQKKNIEYINIKCHDLRKQLDYLRDGDISEDRLNEIKKQTRIYNAIAKTGNETLDVILTERSLYCESEGIRFTYMVDGQRLSSFDVIDICAVFCNLIDNAIEAVMQLPEDNRLISLKVDVLGNFLHIEIYNLFAEEPVQKDGNFKTSKGDEINHGFGLKSVRMTVDNYHGKMRVYTEDNVFYVNILIPIE